MALVRWISTSKRSPAIGATVKVHCSLCELWPQTLWTSLGRNKDYIRNKKPNGYQSLHSVVRADDGHELEVQIRTFKMHYMAEYGEQACREVALQSGS